MRLVPIISLALLLCGVANAQAPVEGVVERPDVKLHYRVHGEKGPYAVIVCGGPGAAVEMLQPFADHLKDRFRCVMLEQRGTGRSKLETYSEQSVSFDAYIADLEALRIALKQERIVLVGSSWGMTLSLAYAGAHPDKVLALMTIGSGHISVASEKAWMARLRARSTDDQRRSLDNLIDRRLGDDETAIEWLRIILPSYFYRQEEAEKFRSGLKVGDLNARISRLSPSLFRRLDEYVLGRLGRIACPILVVQGRQDLAPESTAHEIRE